MKAIIDIPKEFEEDLKDNFQDFCNRVIADITFLLDEEEPLCCGNYERETAEMFLSAFEKATVIPDDATNGEVIKTMFNDFESALLLQVISKEWWNAPYRKEQKNEPKPNVRRTRK